MKENLCCKMAARLISFKEEASSLYTILVFLSADRVGSQVPAKGGAEPARALLPEGAEREAEREGPRRHRRQGAQRVPLPLPQGDRALHRVQGGGRNGEHASFTYVFTHCHCFKIL